MLRPLRVGLGLLIASLAVALAGLAPGPAPRPAAAQGDIGVQSVQRADWGLATELETRSINNFDALGWAVEEAGGRIFVGGKFRDVTNGQRTETQPYLAAFTVGSGTWIDDVAPTVGGAVLALEPSPDGALFVGGEMDSWNGQEIGALAKIDPATGAMWPGWNTRLYGGTSVVRDLSLGPDGFLYAAGTFTTASDAGTPRNVHSVVRIDPESGAIDWSWLPVTNGGVWGVSRSYTNDTVYLAGWNDMMFNRQVVGISSVNPDVLQWGDFEMNYRCCDHMYDIQATPFGTVLAVGEQHGAYFYDESQGDATGLTLVTGHVTSYDSRYQDSSNRRGGDYQDIELVGDRLFASCHCWGSHSTGIGFTPGYRGNLAKTTGSHTGRVSSTIAYDARTGERDMAFDPYMAGDIGGWGVLQASDGCVWIAGGINAVGQPGSQSAGRDLVRLCPQGVGNGVQPVPSCSLERVGSMLRVNWPTVDGVADYVIHRSVDGGSPSWRGVIATPPFDDTDRDAELVYTVTSRSEAQRKSAPTTCGSDLDGDGVVDAIDVDADNDGLADEVEDLAAGQLANPGETTDSDGDGTEDRLDLDADNDSIPDVVEAGLADADGDFMVDEPALQGSVDPAPDTDGDGTPDYRDLDADGDGVFDIVGTVNAALDTNGDGRVDGSDDGGGIDGNGNGIDDLIDDPVIAVPPVAACSATIDGDAVVVAWEAAPEAADYIIRRSVDGGQEFWRGRVEGATSFNDTNRDGTLAYSVTARNDQQTAGPATGCETVVVEQPAAPDAPTGCTATRTGDRVAVAWDPADRAVDYIVYRSVDGGQDFWRGRVEGATSFDDSNRDGTLAYHVIARNQAGERSARGDCVTTGEDPVPADVPAVDACDVVVAPDNPNAVRISWTAPAGADANTAYVIHRTVDGGNRFWRGRVEGGTSFDDTLRTGLITYSVTVKVDNRPSEPTACTPEVEGA